MNWSHCRVFAILTLILFTSPSLSQDHESEEESLTSSEEADLRNLRKFNTHSYDFGEIVTTAAFIDKSMFIKTFVEDHGIVVLTSPKHFGRSTNINMIKRFLEIEVDDDGNRKTNNTSRRQPIRDTDNYRLFVDNNLKITENETFMNNHFGKHPVIHVDMEFDNIHITSYDVAVDQMKYIVHLSYIDHEYLKRSERLKSEERRIVKKWCSTSGYSEMNEADLADSLRLLSRFLFKHFDNRRVYVLIDNFDSPVTTAILFAFTEDIMGGIYRLVTSVILKVLQNNRHVHRGLISGMSYIAGSPALYNLGYVHVCRFLEDHSYAGFHGFTQQEALDLFSADRFNLSTDMAHRAETTYGGYRSCGNVTLYNPWSLIHLLMYKEFRDWWPGRSIPLNLENLLRVPALREEITMLSEGRERQIRVKKIYAPDDVIRLRDLILKPELHQELHYTDKVLALLVEIGYLTYVPTGQNFSGQHQVKVPNNEMRRKIIETIKRYRKHYGALEDETVRKRKFKYSFK